MPVLWRTGLCLFFLIPLFICIGSGHQTSAGLSIPLQRNAISLSFAEVLLDLAEAVLSFDLDAAGFSVAEIDLMILDAAADEDEDAVVAPVPGPPVSQPGDVRILGDHAILCGTALEDASYRDLMGKLKADLVFTDLRLMCRLPATSAVLAPSARRVRAGRWGNERKRLHSVSRVGPA